MDWNDYKASLPSRNAFNNVIIPSINAAAEKPSAENCKMNIFLRNVSTGDSLAEDYKMNLSLKYAVIRNSLLENLSSSGLN